LTHKLVKENDAQMGQQKMLLDGVSECMARIVAPEQDHQTIPH